MILIPKHHHRFHIPPVLILLTQALHIPPQLKSNTTLPRRTWPWAEE